MSQFMKFALSASAILLLAVSTAMAQGFRDAGAKTRGEFGRRFESNQIGPARVARSIYVVPAPQQTVSAAPTMAPAARQIAQAPTVRRAFSIDPDAAEVTPTPSIAPRAPVIQSRGVPAWRSRVSAQQPTYLLPKTDPRKFGG